VSLIGKRSQIDCGSPCQLVLQRSANLEIQVDGDEITMYLGHHTHCHFSLYMVDTDPDPEEKISAEAVKLLTDLLDDRVVIWSQIVGGKPTSGGSYYLGEKQTLRPVGAESFLWSGKRV
jgi:hypothetical protein